MLVICLLVLYLEKFNWVGEAPCTHPMCREKCVPEGLSTERVAALLASSRSETEKDIGVGSR